MVDRFSSSLCLLARLLCGTILHPLMFGNCGIRASILGLVDLCIAPSIVNDIASYGNAIHPCQSPTHVGLF